VRALVLGLALVALAVAAPAALAHRGESDDHGHGHGHRGPQHIFFIMMENHGFSQIIGNTADAPYINRLAAHNGLATDYFGVTHPSLPNYLSAISGSFQGIWDDCKAGADVMCPPEEFIPGSGDGTAGDYLTPEQITSSSAQAHLFDGQNLVDQLEEKGLSWKAYMENLPETGSQVEYWPVIGGTTVKLYAQKHNPFMYFSDINYPGSPRLNQVVPLEGNLSADLASGNVPNFVWISPNQCHDMHGISPSTAALVGLPACGFPDSGLDHGAIQLGDAFLKQTVSAIRHSKVWRHSNSAIVIAWDEDDYSGFAGTSTSPVGKDGVVLGGAQVPAIVVSSREDDARTSDVSANHYNMLATIERMWHLGCVGATCGMRRSDLLTSLF
jgi:hypothetical protein